MDAILAVACLAVLFLCYLASAWGDKEFERKCKGSWQEGGKR